MKVGSVVQRCTSDGNAIYPTWLRGVIMEEHLDDMFAVHWTSLLTGHSTTSMDGIEVLKEVFEPNDLLKEML